jgi:uncharacterized protein YecE (DUF72 family)
MPKPRLRIGCAGWTIPARHAGAFEAQGSHLARYARKFNTVEINSSFYHPHRRVTYERWRATVPDNFSFAAKLPKAVTHELRLVAAEPALDIFREQIGGLGSKLGPLLVQLPPSLVFDHGIAAGFFAALRRRVDGSVVCEPRHATWFTAEAEALLAEFHVARAAADPPIGTVGLTPGGWRGLQYFRLHGTPRVYFSEYDDVFLANLARRLSDTEEGVECWCIFDNTALGAASANALALQALTADFSGGDK